jgi:cytochrome c2
MIGIPMLLASAFLLPQSPGEELDGKDLFVRSNCTYCHSVATQGIERTGPDSLLLPDGRTALQMSNETWVDLSSAGNQLRQAHTDPRGFDKGSDSPEKKAVKTMRPYLRGEGSSRPGEEAKHGWIRVKGPRSRAMRSVVEGKTEYVILGGSRLSRFVGTDDELDVIVNWIMSLRAEER